MQGCVPILILRFQAGISIQQQADNVAMTLMTRYLQRGFTGALLVHLATREKGMTLINRKRDAANNREGKWSRVGPECISNIVCQTPSPWFNLSRRVGFGQITEVQTTGQRLKTETKPLITCCDYLQHAVDVTGPLKCEVTPRAHRSYPKSSHELPQELTGVTPRAHRSYPKSSQVTSDPKSSQVTPRAHKLPQELIHYPRKSQELPQELTRVTPRVHKWKQRQQKKGKKIKQPQHKISYNGKAGGNNGKAGGNVKKVKTDQTRSWWRRHREELEGLAVAYLFGVLWEDFTDSFQVALSSLSDQTIGTRLNSLRCPQLVQLSQQGRQFSCKHHKVYGTSLTTLKSGYSGCPK